MIPKLSETMDTTDTPNMSEMVQESENFRSTVGGIRNQLFGELESVLPSEIDDICTMFLQNIDKRNGDEVSIDLLGELCEIWGK